MPYSYRPQTLDGDGIQSYMPQMPQDNPQDRDNEGVSDGIGAKVEAATMKVGLSFKWFDLWIGFYWDRKAKVLYFCPFPCVVFSFEKEKKRVGA